MQDSRADAASGIRDRREGLKQYLQNNHNRLVGHEKAVREKLVTAINLGLEDAFHDLAVQANTLSCKHANGTPESCSGSAMVAPKFTRLKALLDEGTPSSLMERAENWRKYCQTYWRHSSIPSVGTAA